MDHCGRRLTTTLALSVMAAGFLMLGLGGARGEYSLLAAALVIGFGNGAPSAPPPLRWKCRRASC
eukprot:997512-Pyramimonas_sp.AAC.1